MKHILRALLLLLLLAGTTLVAFAAAPRIATAVAIRQLQSSEASTRRRGLAYVRDERAAPAADAVAACLLRESDPDLTELAGYTLMRTREPSGIAALQTRADREPDSPLKARLIFYAARLADGDVRVLSWLEQGARSGEPWRHAGSAIGLLHLCRPDGAAVLFSQHEALPAEVQTFAFDELRGVTDVMAQAVARPMDWSPDDPSADWAKTAAFWGSYGSRDLLRDALARLQRSDPRWREVERLFHARERVSKWIH